MSYTALVNVDEAATSKLCSFISDILNDDNNENKKHFINNCELYINENNMIQLIQTLLSKSEDILALDNEKGNVVIIYVHNYCEIDLCWLCCVQMRCAVFKLLLLSCTQVQPVMKVK